MAYHGIIECGWKTGIHDVRGIPNYGHPWLVVYRETGEVIGCWSREEARRVLAKLKRGVPGFAVHQ